MVFLPHDLHSLMLHHSFHHQASISFIMLFYKYCFCTLPDLQAHFGHICRINQTQERGSERATGDLMMMTADACRGPIFLVSPHRKCFTCRTWKYNSVGCFQSKGKRRRLKSSSGFAYHATQLREGNMCTPKGTFI